QFQPATSFWPELLAQPTHHADYRHWDVRLEGLTLKMAVSPQGFRRGRVANHIVRVNFDIEVERMADVVFPLA
ncbi:unnamed protein product, partial [Amoebophrya sp. A120]